MTMSVTPSVSSPQAGPVAEDVPNPPGRRRGAVICLDVFHVIARASASVDAVPRGMWNQLRVAGPVT
jgi:hypothetical protein